MSSATELTDQQGARASKALAMSLIGHGARTIEAMLEQASPTIRAKVMLTGLLTATVTVAEASGVTRELLVHIVGEAYDIASATSIRQKEGQA